MPVDIVRSGSSFVFDDDHNPPAKGGHRRFVVLSFDTEAPIDPQIAEAELLLESMASDWAESDERLTAKEIVQALEVLDMNAFGASEAEIGRRFSPDAADLMDSGVQLVNRAMELARNYRAIALGGAR